MALNPAQLDEARNWITSQGLGSYDGSGNLTLTGNQNNSSADSVAGAAKAYFGNDNLAANLAQIGGNNYTTAGVNDFLGKNSPQVDAGAGSFAATNPGSVTSSPLARPMQGGIGGGGGGGGSGAGLGAYDGRNPYLDSMANDIQRRSGQDLGFGLSDIRGNAVGVGGLGGSRQGVAEGLAISRSNDNLQGNLANLYGTDYTQAQGRNLQQYGIDTNANLTRSGQSLQRYGMDQSTALGYAGQDLSRYGINVNGALTLGSQALQNQGQNQNFYSTNRSQDLQQAGLGANLYGQGNAGYVGQGQDIYGIGSTQQQAPWNVNNNASQNISPYTGFGSTNTQSGSYGGGANGFAGGALAGAQIGKNLGFGGSGYGNGYSNYGNGITGTGSWSTQGGQYNNPSAY